MTEPVEQSLFEAPPMGEQERMVEAILFASAEPVTLPELVARMPHGCDPAEALVVSLEVAEALPTTRATSVATICCNCPLAASWRSWLVFKAFSWSTLSAATWAAFKAPS